MELKANVNDPESVRVLRRRLGTGHNCETAKRRFQAAPPNHETGQEENPIQHGLDLAPKAARCPAIRSVNEALLAAVRQLRAGAEVDHSFRVIDSELRPRLLGYFRANSFSREDAEDLVQKTLTRVYLGIRQLEDEGRFLGWLFAIARNVRLTAVERRQRERKVVDERVELREALPDHRDPSWTYEQKLDRERLDAVRAAIEELPPQQRQCLLLRVRDELSYEEIAETLRLSVNTIRNHLAAAKKRLRRSFEARIATAA